jgi:hypothetical protein
MAARVAVSRLGNCTAQEQAATLTGGATQEAPPVSPTQVPSQSQVKLTANETSGVSCASLPSAGASGKTALVR